MKAFDPFAPIAKTPSLKFPTIGTRHLGTITKIGEPIQCTNYTTKAAEKWPSGDPIMQVPMTLQTGEIDPKTPDHTGEWTLWVRIAGTEGSMLHAIRKSVEAAAAPTIEVGGKLLIEFYATDPSSRNPQNPRKMYRAEYQAPTPASAFAPQAQAPAPAGLPQAPVTPAQAVPAPAPAPAQPQAAAPAPAPAPAPVPQAAPTYDLTHIQALIQQGHDDQAIYTATGAPLSIIAQARALVAPF